MAEAFGQSHQDLARPIEQSGILLRARRVRGQKQHQRRRQ
jgi:hypothetical protein